MTGNTIADVQAALINADPATALTLESGRAHNAAVNEQVAAAMIEATTEFNLGGNK